MGQRSGFSNLALRPLCQAFKVRVEPGTSFPSSLFPTRTRRERRGHGPAATTTKAPPVRRTRADNCPATSKVKSTALTKTVQTAASHTGGVRHRDKTPYEKRGEGHNSNQTRLAV